MLAFGSVLGAWTVGPALPEVYAQPWRVGVLGPAEPRFDEVAGGLKQGLRDHGYVEGPSNFWRDGSREGTRPAPAAAAKGLIRQRARVLFVIGSELTRLARQVSADVPIVFLTPGDPVAAGIVSSLAHPGENTTGMTFEYPELPGKRLELLKEMVPSIRRVLVLVDPHLRVRTRGKPRARDVARAHVALPGRHKRQDLRGHRCGQ